MATEAVSMNPQEGQKTKPKCAATELKYASTSVLLETAAGVVEDVVATSNIFDADSEKSVPKFKSREVTTGAIIGRGGFCVVREVERIRTGKKSRGAAADGKKGSGMFSFMSRNKDDELNNTNHSYKSDGNHSKGDESVKGGVGNSDYRQSRDWIAAHSRKDRKSGARYVMKTVSYKATKLTYMKGNVDIALEAKFLSVLDHPNIISMVGMSKVAPCHEGFFLILEKMDETLSQRLKSWEERHRLMTGFMSCISGGPAKEQELYRDRMEAAYDIACALHYIHSKNIVFRDLKPDNIGFDSSGTLKVFDFGLAKELLDKDKRVDGTYRNLTKMTGAIRYMAPEVGEGQPYNKYADVYSFSMLLWYMLALEPPFGFFTEHMIRDRVHRKGVRPSVFRKWNAVLGEMMKCSWDVNVSQRPSFLEISLVLKQELIDCDGSTVVTLGSNRSVGSARSLASGDDRKDSSR